MSRINDINKYYGSEFNIAIANTWSSYVMQANGLPVNTIIITSPYDNDTYEDLGVHSILMTDSYGEVARITYSLCCGNGLKFENDAVKLAVDEDFLDSTSNELSLNVSKIIDNASVKFDNGILSSNVKVLQTASKDRFGIISVDGYTVKSNKGKIYVDTENLDLSDNNSSSFGIVSSTNGSPVTISNGTISIDSSKIQKSSSNDFGISKCDGVSVSNNNGTLKTTLSNLQKCSNSTFGLVKEDNISIKSNNGVLTADFSSVNNLLIKVDGVTTMVDNNGFLTINDSVSISNSLATINSQIESLNERIATVEEHISDYSPAMLVDFIFAFNCTGLASATLIKPSKFDQLPEDMESQKITAEFNVRTNCPFRIYIDYLDNVIPQVILYEINYNDIEIYSGNTGLNQTFQSTNNKDAKIKFSWLCKNYRSNDNEEYSNKTRINLEVRCANDASIKKSVKYSIIRYNSAYDTSINKSSQNEEIIINKSKKSKNYSKYELHLNSTGDLIRQNLDSLEYEYEYTGKPIVFYPSYFSESNVPVEKLYNATIGNDTEHIYVTIDNGTEVKQISMEDIDIQSSDPSRISVEKNDDEIKISYIK